MRALLTPPKTLNICYDFIVIPQEAKSNSLAIYPKSVTRRVSNGLAALFFRKSYVMQHICRKRVFTLRYEPLEDAIEAMIELRRHG